MLQPVIAFLEEGFDLKRHASATISGPDYGARIGFRGLLLEGHDWRWIRVTSGLGRS